MADLQDETVQQLIKQLRENNKIDEFESGSGLDRRLRVLIDASVQTPEFAIKLYDKSKQAIAADVEFGKFYDDLHRAFGQMPDATAATLDRAGTAIVQAKRRFDELGDAFFKTQKFTDEVIAGGEELEEINKQFDYLSKNFKSLTDVQQAQNDVIGELIFQNSEYVNQMDTVTLRKIPAYAKAMGISSTEVAGLIERNIVLNKKSTSEMLDNVAAYSDSIARRTGLDMKQLQQQSIKVLNNIKQFGPLTEAEATKMTATLMQMGLKMETFASIQGKLQDFGGAASAAGDVSQLTGGQVMLDAQELMYLASEDPVEMMTTLRKRFLEAGFDREQFLSMTKMDQKALQAQLGISFEEISMMLDRTKPLTEEAIELAQKSADELGDVEKYKTITEQLSNIEGSIKDHDELMKHLRTKRYFEQKESAYNAAGDIAEAENKFRRSLEVPGLDSAAIKKQFEGIEKAAKKMKEFSDEINVTDILTPEKMIEGVSTMLDGMVDITGAGVQSMTDAFQAGLAPLFPSSVPKMYLPIVAGVGYLMEELNKKGMKLGEEFSTNVGSKIDIVPKKMELLDIDNTSIEKLVKDIKKETTYLENEYSQGFERMLSDKIQNLDLKLIDKKHLEQNLSELSEFMNLKSEELKKIYNIGNSIKEKSDNDSQEINNNIKGLTEKLDIFIANVNQNQSMIVNAMSKNQQISVNLDGKEVGKGILNVANIIESDAGFKFNLRSR